jgi:hypothetical protein
LTKNGGALDGTEVINNISLSATTACFANAVGTPTNVTSSNNLSTDSTADVWVGSNHVENATASDIVNSVTEDFRLKRGSAAIDAGTTVATFSTDATGLARAGNGSAWDIGALEFTVARQSNLLCF